MQRDLHIVSGAFVLLVLVLLGHALAVWSAEPAPLVLEWATGEDCAPNCAPLHPPHADERDAVAELLRGAL